MSDEVKFLDEEDVAEAIEEDYFDEEPEEGKEEPVEEPTSNDPDPTLDVLREPQPPLDKPLATT
jgi:hypothetical protein